MDNNKTTPTKLPLLTGTSVNAKKAELKDYFRQTWSKYESLFSLINNDDAYFLRPEPLRHPLIFYFGHTASFYVNKLILGKYISTRINSKLEAICAVGVDEMSWDDLNTEHYEWPSVTEVKAYRNQVATLIERLIDDMDLLLPITKDSLAWIILMGCEHERIHLETSSVIMRMLPLKYLSGAEAWPLCKDSGIAPENTLVTIKGKSIAFGKPSTDHTFGWDNEYGCNSLDLDDFKVSKYLVSNQEYMEFVKQGGYQNLELWTEEGQQWLLFTKATMPKFWLEKVNHVGENTFFQRNLLNEIPLPLNWPVEINYLEAKAFCQWKNSTNQPSENKNYRLLTEAEWLCLRDKVPGDLASWESSPGNINCEQYASSCPVDKFEHGEVFDVVGNVWQWTESTIDGLQGFEVHPLYDDFSTPTFDGKHNLIKGGSWISTGNEAQRYSRYAFRRHFQQHAGFRYVQSPSKEIPNLAPNYYETDVAICQQLHAQYGSTKSSMPVAVENYSHQIMAQITHVVKKHNIPSDKCLDLGCSVGLSSFLLSKQFNLVDGVDFSARYIRHCVGLQQGNSARYQLENEGDIVDYYEVSLSKLGLTNCDNVNFSQGDASNLKNKFEGYDVILAQHILEQSYDPKLFLQTIHQRLNRNGLLVIVSNYDFDEQLTAKENWLGGIKVNGENVTGFDGLTLQLSGKFNLIKQNQLTRPLKVNRRNFTLSFPHLSVWQLK